MMSNMFWKNFHLCFSSIKCLPTISPSPPSKHDQNHSSSSSTSTTLLLNSLYNDISSSDFSTSKSLTPSTEDYFSCSSSDSDPADSTSPPDFAAIFASQRLFFSSPGRSNSIIESPDSSRPDTTQEAPLGGAGVAVNKYSPNPYMDFRCSMQEMIEARNLEDVMSDCDFLHELLLCYLKLNPKHTHKFIISAFADLLICLLSSSSDHSSDTHPKLEGRRRLQH